MDTPGTSENYKIFVTAYPLEPYEKAIAGFLAGKINDFVEKVFKTTRGNREEYLHAFFTKVAEATGAMLESGASQPYTDLIRNWSRAGKNAKTGASTNLVIAAYYTLHTVPWGKGLAAECDEAVFDGKSYEEFTGKRIPGGHYPKDDGEPCFMEPQPVPSFWRRLQERKSWVPAAAVVFLIAVVAAVAIWRAGVTEPKFALQIWLDKSGSLQSVRKEALVLTRASVAQFLNKESPVEAFQLGTFASVTESSTSSSGYMDTPIERVSISNTDDIGILNQVLEGVQPYGPTNFEITLLAAARDAEAARKDGLTPIVMIISDGQANAYTTEGGDVSPSPYVTTAPDRSHHNGALDEISGRTDGSNEIAHLQKAAAHVFVIPVGEVKPESMELLKALATDHKLTSPDKAVADVSRFIQQTESS